jgi:outer membrane protein assembly factor BamB
MRSTSRSLACVTGGLFALVLAVSACGPTTPVPSDPPAAAGSPQSSADVVATNASSRWSPQYRGGPSRTGEMPGPGIATTPTTLWTLALGGPAVSSPAVVDGVLYVSAGDRRALAVDVASGSIRWAASTTEPLRSSPAFGDGLVIFNDEGGAVSAFRAADGGVAWTVAAGAAPESMPLIADDLVVIGTQGGDAVALDRVTGERRWTFSTGGTVGHAAASDAKRIVFGSADGNVYAVDPASGAETWRFAGGAGQYTTPAIRNGLVYLVGHEVDATTDVLFALDAATGAERWRYAGGSMFAPAVDSASIYVADAAGDLRALDARTGEVTWSTRVGGSLRPGPAIVDTMLYLFGGEHEALGIDAATGAISWRAPLDGRVEYGTTAADGRLFAATSAGTLIALGPERLAASPPASVPPAAPAVGATVLADLSGTPDGLTDPTGLDVDPSGRIWVAEGARDAFAIFAPDGSFIERWGAGGTGPGEFDFDNANSGNPTADIAFTPDGDFYVADTGNFRIQRFAADRTLVGAWGGFGKGPGKFAIPFAIALDEAGSVYVTTGNGEVQVFDADGGYLRTIGEPGSGDGQLANAGITVSGDRLLVADWDNHRVVVFGLDGTFVENWVEGQLGDPNAISAAPGGRVFVTTADGRVHVLGTDGSLLASIDPEGSDAVFVTALDDTRFVTTEWRGDWTGANELGRIYELELP